MFLPKRPLRAATFLAALCHLFQAAGLAGGNALDRVDFGTPASEAAHRMHAGEDAPLAGVGALRQTYRAPQPVDGEKPHTANDQLRFTVKVDPTRQNYLTVRLWGGDQQTAGLFLQGVPKGYGALDWNGTGGPPPFPERFYYTTIPIPLAQTSGQTAVELVLYEGNATKDRPGRPIYSAYAHIEPLFVPEPRDATGVPLPLTGQRVPEKLGTSRVAATLRANRQAIYGPGGTFQGMLARQIMPGTKGAPPEVIGLDLWTQVAGWKGEGKSADAWRDQAGGHGHGSGYGTNPDELLSVLTSTYLLPPFVDAEQQAVAGLDHFRDPELLRRIVLALDATTYVQSSDGSFNDQGEDQANQRSAQGHWQGLTSTPRAAGAPYAGSRKRGSGWSLTLEGANTATLGWAILQLLNDPAAAPLFQRALAESFDANLDGQPIKRAHAYARMLNNQVSYQVTIFGGGTVAQAMMATNSIYSNLVALHALERAFPYPEKRSSFPPETVTKAVEVPYPARTAEEGVAFARQAVGVDPVTKIMGNLYRSQFVNYTISRGGLGEAGGAISGGYDGRYGTILPAMAARLAQTAAWDRALDPAGLAAIRAQAGAAADAFTRFISPQEKFRGLKNEFTFAQEDFITYRNPYNANANGNSFNVGARSAVADPLGGMSTPLARRAVYLEALYDIRPRDFEYLKDLAAYERTLLALANLEPAQLPALPGEPGQPASAWVDVQTGATAAYYRGERFYLNANWRNNDVTRERGAVSHLARIHLTSAAVDRTALVFLPHDAATVQSDGNLSGLLYEPWVVRYGPWLVMGNPSAKPAALRLPTGAGLALDLVTGRTCKLGTALPVAPGQAAVVVLPLGDAQPVVPGPAQPVENGLYTLTALHSGQALDRALRQQTPDQSPGQQWLVTWTEQGCLLKNVAAEAWLAESGGLKLEKDSAGENRRWKCLVNGLGCTLLNQASGLAVDVRFGSGEVGQSVGLHPYTGALNQTWRFSPVKP